MKARNFILSLALLTTGSIWTRPSRVTQNDPYPLFTSVYPYNYLSTNERRQAKGMDTIYANETFRFSLSALRSTAHSSTDTFKQNNQPLFNIPGPWNIIGLFYNQSPVETQPPGTAGPLQLTPLQAYLAQVLNINTNTNTGNTAEAQAFQKVIDPVYQDSKQEFGYMDMPGEYRKHGIRAELDVLLGCGFGFRASTGVSDINVIPCVAGACENTFESNSDQTLSTACGATNETKCDPLRRTCEADGRTCTVNTAESNTCGNNQSCIFESFTRAEKDLVLNKMIDRFDVLARALGYDPTNYNETDIEDIDVQLYWRHPVHVNEDRASWPYFIVTPFFVGHVTIAIADKVSPTELFAVPHGNNGYTAYGLSSGFSLDFVDMVQIAFDAGMTRFEEDNRACVPVPTSNLQQGILPRFADACIKPGTNWTFGAALYGYYIFDRLSFHIEYRIVSHTEDEVTFTHVRKLTDQQLQMASNSGAVTMPSGDTTFTQDQFTLSDIDKKTFIENRKWESHVVNSGLNYDISPNVSLGFLWQAPATRRNAFKQTSLLWTIAVTF